MTIKGVDVAGYQSENFDVSGLDFAIVKATQGVGYENPKHAAQVAHSRAHGLVVGHYHFLETGNIDAQAKHFVTSAKPQAGDILACDWEGYNGHHATSAEKDAFIKAVKALKPGLKTGLYCNLSDWKGRDTSGYFGDYFWPADPSHPVGKPNVKAPWVFDQYGSGGGIDHDVANFDSRAALRDWAGGVVAKPKPKPTPAPKPSPKPAKPSLWLSKLIVAANMDHKRPQGKGIYESGTKLVEKALKAEGLLPAKYASDGYFGTLTVEAYAKWQRKTVAGPYDGIPGKASLTKLGAKHGFTVKG